MGVVKKELRDEVAGGYLLLGSVCCWLALYMHEWRPLVSCSSNFLGNDKVTVIYGSSSGRNGTIKVVAEIRM